MVILEKNISFRYLLCIPLLLTLIGCATLPPLLERNSLHSNVVFYEPPITTAVATMAPSPTPTATPRPTATSTPLPTRTPTPTQTPLPTPIPTATPFVDRSCLEPKFTPYYRDQITELPWPTAVSEPQSHFFLNRPLSGEALKISHTYPYGYDGGVNSGLLMHVGTDLNDPQGTPILAMGDGLVVYARSDEEEMHGWKCNWYGNLVVILHDRKWKGEPIYTLYGHVQNITVKEGARVMAGDQVAELGMGGAAQGVHLHVEVRVGDDLFTTTRNPMLWIRPSLGKGVLIGRIVNPKGHAWQAVFVEAVPENKELPQRETWSYLGDTNQLAHPDDQYAENFVLSDLLAGDYTVSIIVKGRLYRQKLTVREGLATVVEFVTVK